MELRTKIIDALYFKPGFEVALLEDGTKAVIKGTPMKLIGEVILVGEWRYNTRYNENQFEASAAYVADQSDVLYQLFASNFVAGISEAKAKSLISTLGSRTLEVLDAALPALEEGKQGDDIEWRGEMLPGDFVLLQVKGIGPIVIRQILESWQKVRENVRSAMLAMQIAMPYYLYKKVYDTLGDKGFCDVVNNRPYDLSDYCNMPWEMVDRIAQLDLPGKTVPAVDDPSRLAAALRSVIRTNTSDGNLAMPYNKAIAEATMLAGVDGIAKILVGTEQAKMFKSFRHTDGITYVMLASVYKMEAELAEYIVAKSQAKVHQVPTEFLSDESIIETAKFVFSPNFVLDDCQIQAVRTALTNPMSIITGGPGTGKTTITKVILHILAKSYQSVVLACPTGKAAVRMTEATGYPASTLHRAFSLFSDHPECPPCKAVEIDEFSMTSTELAYQTLMTIPEDVRIIIVGDADQLPPVGAGEPLIQMIEAGVPCVRLQVIHRQGVRSGIVSAAHDVLNGKYPTTTDDCRVVKVRMHDLDEMLVLAITQLQKANYDAEDILVMATVKAHGAGVEAIGKTLQQHWNGGSLQVPGTRFLENDRVMMRVNNYQVTRGDGEKGRMNGEMGFVRPPDSASALSVWSTEKDWKASVLFDRSEKHDRLSSAEVEDLMLAWCITVHKSQGSQAPAVVFIASPTQRLALRQIVYTAITRAEAQVIIFDVDDSLQNYLDNVERLRRVDLLAGMITKLVQGEKL